MTDDRLRTADISKKRKFLKAHSGYLSIFSEKFFAELDHFKTKGINTKKRKSSNTENLKSASSLLELPYNRGKDAHQFASFPKKAVNFRTFDTTVITEQFNP